MKKSFSISLLFMIFTLSLQAQSTTVDVLDVIKLKSGEVFTGKIVVKNDQVLMLEMDDGRRFQFMLADIETIKRKNLLNTEEELDGKFVDTSCLGISVGFSGGVIGENNTKTPNSPGAGVSLAIGLKNIFDTYSFVGGGVGLDAIFISDAEKNNYVLPLFIQFDLPFNKNKISPAVSSKFGYGIFLNDDYKSNFFFQVSGGVNIKTESFNHFFVGIYFQGIRVNGRVMEQNELGKFEKNGNDILPSYGVRLAFLF